MHLCLPVMKSFDWCIQSHSWVEWTILMRLCFSPLSLRRMDYIEFAHSPTLLLPLETKEWQSNSRSMTNEWFADTGCMHYSAISNISFIYKVFNLLNCVIFIHSQKRKCCEKFYLAKPEQFMCAKNPRFTVMNSDYVITVWYV